MLIKEELTAQKRNAFQCQSRLKKIEAPFKMMEDTANHQRKKAAEAKAKVIEANLKATSL